MYRMAPNDATSRASSQPILATSIGDTLRNQQKPETKHAVENHGEQHHELAPYRFAGLEQRDRTIMSHDHRGYMAHNNGKASNAASARRMTTIANVAAHRPATRARQVASRPDPMSENSPALVQFTKSSVMNLTLASNSISKSPGVSAMKVTDAGASGPTSVVTS